MRIGFVVDGDAEYNGLGCLYPRLQESTGNTFLRVLRADLQPYAPYAAMARSCKSRLQQLEGRGADRILILIDREERPECPGAHASALESAARTYVDRAEVWAVVKDKCLENWLVADPQAMRCQPGRFEFTDALERRVCPNRADRANAKRILGTAVKGDYEKVADGRRILDRTDIATAGLHSRSFRRFLRLVGFPAYERQSRRP